MEWNQTYGGVGDDYAHSLIQTSDNGYAMVGQTSSFGVGGWDIWVVKVDSFGNLQWNRTYGDSGDEAGFSIAETIDERFLIGGWLTASGSIGVVLKTELETGTTGLSRTGLSNSTLTLYRGSEDPYWNYVRARLWEIKVPTWVYGDIDMDGDVDIFDIVKACGNYGQTYYGVATISGGFGLVALGGVKRFKSKKENT